MTVRVSTRDCKNCCCLVGSVMRRRVLDLGSSSIQRVVITYHCIVERRDHVTYLPPSFASNLDAS